MKVVVASAILAVASVASAGAAPNPSEPRQEANLGDFSEEGYRDTGAEIKPPYEAVEGYREALVTEAKVAEIPPRRVVVSPPTPVPTAVPVVVVQSAPIAQAVPPTGQLPSDLTQLVETYFPGQSGIALRVMMCESGGKSWETGDAGERGLMQIHPTHARPRGNKPSFIEEQGYTWDDMYLPEPNLAVAAALLRSVKGRWSPTWSCA